EILDSEEAVLGFAQNMTWSGKHPKVTLVEKAYAKGVSVTKKIMDDLKLGFSRKLGIEKWSVLILPRTSYG
ncbi:MAG: ISAzo13 family transposase, partial [Gammaproteobacteria bacterium]|nr:ISAzo13 family transposase [Gammaproteobacteria bacterium]